MGIFDLFGREPKTKTNNTSQKIDFAFNVGNSNAEQPPVSVFQPQSYEDVEKIINALKAGKNSVVHLNELKPETAVRVLDMLSGAVFALGGGVYEMGKNIFMFSPAGVEVN